MGPPDRLRPVSQWGGAQSERMRHMLPQDIGEDVDQGAPEVPEGLHLPGGPPDAGAQRGGEQEAVGRVLLDPALQQGASIAPRPMGHRYGMWRIF